MRLLTIIVMLFLLFSTVLPVAALDLKTIDIVVDRNGDAQMKVSYSNNFLETAAIATNYGDIRQKVEDRFSDAIGKDSSTRCIGPGSTVFSIRNFAEMSGNTFTTPRMDLGKIPEGMGYSFGFIGVGDVSPDITIAFPDNTSRQFSQSTIIPLVTYTLSSDGVTRAPPILPDEMQCGTPADLIAVKKPFAAVAIGIAVAMIAGNMAVGAASTVQSAFMGKITVFFQKLFGTLVTSRLSTEEVKRRKLSAKNRHSVFLGFSAIEILAAVAGAVVFGFSFMVAKGTWRDPTTFSIFFIVSGFGIAIHEMAHRFVASRNKGISEFKFWELGSMIMLVTGGLFGLVFAKPYRTVISNAATLEKRSMGIIMLAGPVISVVLALLFLALIPMGGIYSDIGNAGFSVNLLSAVYAMLPFNPMDGEKIYSWSHARWVLVFVPLFIFYILLLLH